jgi:hypothetical protein
MRRKIIIIGLVLMALLTAMPAAVSAGATDTVTVSGSIGGYIDVAVTDATLSLNEMSVGTPGTAATTITVDSSYNSWGVDVSATNGGYMQGTPGNLDTLFDISNDAGSTWHQLATTWTDFFTGSAGVDQDETVNVRQTVTAADPSGTYSITVTFTGASN